MATQIWQHVPSGERFAIRFNAKDEIIGATGPIVHREATAYLADDWDDERELTEEFQDTGLGNYIQVENVE